MHHHASKDQNAQREPVLTQLRESVADGALRASEYRYRSLFDSMTEGFALQEVIFSREGEPSDCRFLDVNPAFEQLVGLRRDALIGKTVRQVLPNDEPGWTHVYGRIALNGESAHFTRISQTSGRSFEVFAYSPASGQVACIFLDTTDKRRAEAALSASQERLRLATDAAQLGTFDVDFKTDAVVCSDLARGHFGLSMETPITRETLRQFAHPDDLERLQQAERIALQPESGGNYAIEYRVCTGGMVRWLSVRGRVYFDLDDRPNRFIGITHDITDRKRLDQERQMFVGELKRQRALLVSTINQVPLGIMVAESGSGRILLANDEMARITADSLDYESGLDCLQRLSATGEDGKPLATADWPLARAANQHQSIQNQRIEIKRPDGTVLVVSVSATPVRDADGTIIAAVALTADISSVVSHL